MHFKLRCFTNRQLYVYQYNVGTAVLIKILYLDNFIVNYVISDWIVKVFIKLRAVP